MVSVSSQYGTVELLVENGTEVNAKDNEGATPFHYACEDDYLSLVQFLVSRGANVNAKTIQGRTPLHVAAKRNRKDVVWFLVRHCPWLVL